MQLGLGLGLGRADLEPQNDATCRLFIMCTDAPSKGKGIKVEARIEVRVRYMSANLMSSFASASASLARSLSSVTCLWLRLGLDEGLEVGLDLSSIDRNLLRISSMRLTLPSPIACFERF